ncbi:hypothetical protein ACPV5R_00890 [Vibrio astriarenae]
MKKALSILTMISTSVFASDAVLNVEGQIQINGETVVDSYGQFVVGGNVVIDKDGKLQGAVNQPKTYLWSDFPDHPAEGKSVLLNAAYTSPDQPKWEVNLVYIGHADGWTRQNTPKDGSAAYSEKITLNPDGTESRKFDNGYETLREANILAPMPEQITIGQTWTYSSIDTVTENDEEPFEQAKVILFNFSGITDYSVGETTLKDCGRFMLINEFGDRGYQVRCKNYGLVENLWPQDQPTSFWFEKAVALDPQ